MFGTQFARAATSHAGREGLDVCTEDGWAELAHPPLEPNLGPLQPEESDLCVGSKPERQQGGKRWRELYPEFNVHFLSDPPKIQHLRQT